jgi:hypothetical protein
MQHLLHAVMLLALYNLHQEYSFTCDQILGFVTVSDMDNVTHSHLSFWHHQDIQLSHMLPMPWVILLHVHLLEIIKIFLEEDQPTLSLVPNASIVINLDTLLVVVGSCMTSLNIR